MFDTSRYTGVKDRPRKGSPEVWRYYDEYGEMQGRTCARCAEVKTVEDFYRRNQAPDGYGSWCRPCTNDYPNTRITRRK